MFPARPAVTIHQVLTHTSGRLDDFGAYEDIRREEASGRIFKLPLRFPPGSDYAYSNGGYVVLAAVVETAGGIPFREYIRGQAGLLQSRGCGVFLGRQAPAVRLRLEL